MSKAMAIGCVVLLAAVAVTACGQQPGDASSLPPPVSTTTSMTTTTSATTTTTSVATTTPITTTTTTKKPTTTTTATTTTKKPTTTAPAFTPVERVEDYFDTLVYEDPQTGATIEYLFHRPMRPVEGAAPLTIFLHGLGDAVSEQSPGQTAAFVESVMFMENVDAAYSTYTLVPITPGPDQGWWSDPQLDAFCRLILQLKGDRAIDEKRVYISGLSMGGFTTCQLVDRMPPDTFAAAVPMSGASNMSNPAALHNIAFRIYHVAGDTIVNVECSRQLNRQLLQAGHPRVEYVEYAYGNHASPLNFVFQDGCDTFFPWLFSQRLP